ncbi:hypothetical protein KAR91_79855 [Candidatus Pacearchaeota archaeon]|nr:hypothetical protein [Candidatus Pacearchaeota archaeon]
MILTENILDQKWRLVAETIIKIGRPCTIYEIANMIEGKELDKDDWCVGSWRTLAHGSERSGYIKVDRSHRLYTYSVFEYSFATRKTTDG